MLETLLLNLSLRKMHLNLSSVKLWPFLSNDLLYPCHLGSLNLHGGDKMNDPMPVKQAILQNMDKLNF